jgi:hypothetical protein
VLIDRKPQQRFSSPKLFASVKLVNGGPARLNALTFMIMLHRISEDLTAAPHSSGDKPGSFVAALLHPSLRQTSTKESHAQQHSRWMAGGAALLHMKLDPLLLAGGGSKRGVWRRPPQEITAWQRRIPPIPSKEASGKGFCGAGTAGTPCGAAHALRAMLQQGPHCPSLMVKPSPISREASGTL